MSRNNIQISKWLKKRIRWDTQMIHELSDVSGINEDSLKINIIMLCCIEDYFRKKRKRAKYSGQLSSYKSERRRNERKNKNKSRNPKRRKSKKRT